MAQLAWVDGVLKEGRKCFTRVCNSAMVSGVLRPSSSPTKAMMKDDDGRMNIEKRTHMSADSIIGPMCLCFHGGYVAVGWT